MGRLFQMWRLHTALWKGEYTVISGAFAGGVAQVSGLAGIGKSLFTEEYALRFGGAYPGGIFWLRAYGNDSTVRFTSPNDRLADRGIQVRQLAIDLGIAVAALKPEEIESAITKTLERTGLPFLWIVDDVPSSLSFADLAQWIPSSRLGKVILTTRSREYEGIGEHLELSSLEEAEAYDLITTRRRPQDDSEKITARKLASALGHHPLALDVAAAAVPYYGSFAKFQAALALPSSDALDLAQQYVGLLPNGHETSIAKTFLASLRHLDPEGRDLLDLASALDRCWGARTFRVRSTPRPPETFEAAPSEPDELGPGPTLLSDK